MQVALNIQLSCEKIKKSKKLNFLDIKTKNQYLQFIGASNSRVFVIIHNDKTMTQISVKICRVQVIEKFWKIVLLIVAWNIIYKLGTCN